MLDAIIQHAEYVLNMKVVSLKAKIDGFNVKYGMMVKVIISLLKMNKLGDDEREKIFNELFLNTKEIEYLYLFNDFFKTNFPKSSKHSKLTLNETKKLMRILSYFTIHRVSKTS
jgi:hypothetical protein